MKVMKSIYGVALVAVLCVSAVSCSKFLNEELTTQRNMDYYNTSEGLESLVVGSYFPAFGKQFNGECAFVYYNYGTDEFQVGGDESNRTYNNYDDCLAPTVTGVNGNTTAIQTLWNNCYTSIGQANLIISKSETVEMTESVKNKVLGSAYFFRAYGYFHLVQQYGGVPLKLEPSSGPEFEFERATATEVTNQVIDDFTKAYNMLPSSAGLGYLTKSAAAHFLAKALLFRASEINDSWNSSTKQADLQQVVKLCKEVIAEHPLADNYADLWNFTAPDSPCESLSEVILSAQFCADPSTNRSNQHHLYYLSRYDDLPQMQRDLSGGRPYSRLGTTYFVYNAYDLENDSRFWKSFKTKAKANKAAAPYVNGDLGLMYVINRPGDDRYSSWRLRDEVVYSKSGKTIPNVYVAFPKGQTENGALYSEGALRFPSLSKFIDGSRPAMNSTAGQRDAIIARSAETYLIAAEATIRLASLGTGSYDDALTYVNAVRKRAGFKAGEDREKYADGGQAYAASELTVDEKQMSYCPENSYYESMGIPETTAATDITVGSFSDLPEQDKNIIAKLGYTTEYDKALCFILNERTRELCGEFHRWEDLARTRTLLTRARAYNPGAAPNIQEKHYLRPIPQTYLDAVQKDGHNLTSEEKQAQQNPGY